VEVAACCRADLLEARSERLNTQKQKCTRNAMVSLPEETVRSDVEQSGRISSVGVSSVVRGVFQHVPGASLTLRKGNAAISEDSGDLTPGRKDMVEL
jgi:hypothetical protein